MNSRIHPSRSFGSLMPELDKNLENHQQTDLLENLESTLQKLSLFEVDLINQTEKQYRQQTEHMKQIDQLKSHIPDRKEVESSISQINQCLDISSQLVDEFCEKLRHTDLAKSRLTTSLDRINDVLDLRSCRQEIQAALEALNYEEATVQLKRFLSLDHDVLKETVQLVLNSLPGPQKGEDNVLCKDLGLLDPQETEKCFSDLLILKGKLLRTCREQLIKATVESNEQDVNRFFKIFPLMGEHKDGLERYGGYLCSKFLSSDISGSENESYIDKLGNLFKKIATAINDSQPMIETYYGPGYLINVIIRVQKDCDRMSRKILEDFCSKSRIQEVAKIVKEHYSMQTSLHHSKNHNVINRLEPRTVTPILEDLSRIVCRCEVYLDFITTRIKEDLNANSVTESEKQQDYVRVYQVMYKDCDLSQSVQELGDFYVLLEQFYLSESTKIAVLMDKVERDVSENYISSMLDDIFFIIKNSTKRAVSTRCTEVFCAIVNHCVTIIESTFITVQLERMNNNHPSSPKYLSASNNLLTACDYLSELRRKLENDCGNLRQQQFASSNHKAKIEQCLEELSALARKSRSIVSCSTNNSCL